MRILVLTAALALGLIAPALAGQMAAMTNAKTCAETQMQVNAAIAASTDGEKIVEAAGFRDQGDAACAAGRYREGIAHYNIALKLLGVATEQNAAPPPPRSGY